MKVDNILLENLFTAIASLEDNQSSKSLLNDLCTYNELLNMAQRWRAAEMLIQGATYVQVIHETGISSATLSRVNRCIQTGTGGYQHVFKKVHGFLPERN